MDDVIEIIRGAVRDEVGSQLCAWINGRRYCQEQIEEPGICFCETTARAAIEAYQKATGGDTRGEANSLAGMRSEIERQRAESDKMHAIWLDITMMRINGVFDALPELKQLDAALDGKGEHGAALQTQERTNGR